MRSPAPLPAADLLRGDADDFGVGGFILGPRTFDVDHALPVLRGIAFGGVLADRCAIDEISAAGEDRGLLLVLGRLEVERYPPRAGDVRHLGLIALAEDYERPIVPQEPDEVLSTTEGSSSGGIGAMVISQRGW